MVVAYWSWAIQCGSEIWVCCLAVSTFGTATYRKEDHNFDVGYGY